ncbi:MAG: rhodanese-related sulfurtransferase, partial [Salinivirgaceae bacterium]
MFLHNKKRKEQLLQELNNEPFQRITFSFYRYVYLNNPEEFRNQLFTAWSELNCFGRIYVAHEGINAQMSVPQHLLVSFLAQLDAIPGLENMLIKYAVEDDGKSFYKLSIKVRPKIVADGLNDHAYDVTNVGTHLEPLEFHKLVTEGTARIIDMRNHYESEIGRFQNAFCPDTDTFRQAIDRVVDEFRHQKDEKILLYCTGGIRCEKASAYLKHHGFSDVNQLHGGIIAYAHTMKQHNLESKFMGKNFVFDQRLGESIDGQVIARCHQCGAPSDTHTNCANDDCHLLFIQCKACKTEYSGCCSNDCKDILALPIEEQRKLRVVRHEQYSQSKIFKSRLRPNLIKPQAQATQL